MLFIIIDNTRSKLPNKKVNFKAWLINIIGKHKTNTVGKLEANNIKLSLQGYLIEYHKPVEP